MFANLKKDFNYYNLNPKALDEKYADQEPILLIHGNYHNQSAWLSLTHKLKKENFGPVYTVNLPGGCVTEADDNIIKNKIEHIQSQYAKLNRPDVKINLIGHSRGGYMAHRCAYKITIEGKVYFRHSAELKKEIGKVISIGTVVDEYDINNCQRSDPDFNKRYFEITGDNDILARESSLLSDTQKKAIPVGHLELIYNQDTHQQIIHWLKG